MTSTTGPDEPPHDEPTADEQAPDRTTPDEDGPERAAGAATEVPSSTDLEAARNAAVAALARPEPPRRNGVFVDIRDLRQHVGELLRAMLGGYEVDPAGNFTFEHEHARIFITFGASPVGPTVGVFSITNLDVEFTEDLASFLLTTNHRMAFGAFSYDVENRAVWLKHTLLGTMLDVPELQAALMAVAGTAAQIDDRIRDEFGGRAFHDAPQDVQHRTRPPGQDPDAEDATNASGYL